MFDRLRQWMPTKESVAHNRWLRWMGPSLLHPRLWHLSRRGVALGAAIGVFFAFITPIAQIPLSAGASMLLRANVPASVVGTLVNTPPTFAPVYFGAWKVGSWMLGESARAAEAPAILVEVGHPVRTTAPPLASGKPWWERWQQQLARAGKPLMVGALTFSVVFSTLAYFTVSGVWHLRVRIKRRRRTASRR
ncbi:MAG: DUF2062 domain-containing protein [Hydrogenophaga sp.]|jgi:hypothetical protein|nr:DUF2062 domain-containing protein [Hydrogenophaga sp.]